MSVSTKTQRLWRDSGSLRYLAQQLDVTTKQVARYCDNEWIQGSYRTPKGHRRIHYTDDTVQQVSAIVTSVKATNKAIRYHIDTIDYCGTVIRVKGCTKMRDVYRQARKAGLNHRDANNAAYERRGPKPAPLKIELAWDYLLARQGTSRIEVAERMNILSIVPARYLCEAQDATEFRARSRDAWQKLLSANGFPGDSPRSSPEVEEKKRKIMEILHHLLHQPDRESFLSAYNKAAELDTRIMDDAEIFLRIQTEAEEQGGAMLLQIEVLSLKHSEKAPTAAALAQALGISRSALYRTYGKNVIQQTLDSLRIDPHANCATRSDKKKSNTPAAKME